MDYASIAEIIQDIEEHPVESSGQLYHPIPFSEFAHLTTSTAAGEVQKKWSLINGVVNRVSPRGFSGLRVLDIGANGGFYTFSAAQRGAQVTAFEPHPRYSLMGGVIAKEKELPVEWHPVPFAAHLLKHRQFDVGFMFSVFQWMAAGGERMASAANELRQICLASDYLFFELGFNAGKSCLRTNQWNHYAALIDLLKGNTTYRYFKLLGITRIWRSQGRFFILCSNDKRFDDGVVRNLWRRLRI